MKSICCLTLTCLIFLSSLCTAQNNVNGKGQPYGHWMYDKATYGVTEEGDYKIMSLLQYDSARLEQEEGSYTGRLAVKYKASRADITTYNYDGDSLSVNDGIWNQYDTATGKLMLTTEYYNGIVLGRKEYGAEGGLVKYTYTNYEADSSIYLTYMDNHVFRKEFYPPGTGTNKVTQYYPDHPLHIANAEPELNVNFLSRPLVNFNTKLIADTEVTITNFISNGDIDILNKKNQPVSLPLTLRKGKPYDITIQYKPKPSTYNFYDTIAITTTGSQFTYKIICSAWAAHIDRNNVTTLQNVKVSKSKDRYFFIKGCGSVTNFSISDEDGRVSNYAAMGGRVTAVDLNEYQPGAYTIDVTMGDCETEGSGINLKIVE